MAKPFTYAEGLFRVCILKMKPTIAVTNFNLATEAESAAVGFAAVVPVDAAGTASAVGFAAAVPAEAVAETAAVFAVIESAAVLSAAVEIAAAAVAVLAVAAL